MRFLFYIISIFILGALVSCEDYKDCNSPVKTSLGLGFYQMVNQEAADSTLPALTLYGIGRKDSLLSNKESKNKVFVPLNQNKDSTSFFLQPDSTKQNGDTIKVTYTRDLHFVSSGCGFTTFYQLDTATSTTHYIDSIALVNKKIITTNAINIKIFY
jgi:hypothetical protein